MQAIKLEVSDSIADKILWLLHSFKNDVNIERLDTCSSQRIL